MPKVSKNKTLQYFRKKEAEINRNDSLDIAINIEKDITREKILLHITETSEVANKDHFFELQGVKKIGASSVKNDIYLLDPMVDECHLQMYYSDGFVYVSCVSEAGALVMKKRPFGTKKITLGPGEKQQIRNYDTVILGKTTLFFEIYSSEKGLMKKNLKE